MGKRPTEADLGIDMTPEEKEILSRPTTEAVDDIPMTEPDENDTLVQGKPKVEDKPAEETPEAKAVRERDEAGKFVAKSKDEPTKADAGKVEAPADERKVDLRALQEARAENKLLMERMTTLLEATQRRDAAKAKAEEPAPTIPDKLTDPLGYIDYIESRLGKIEGETAAQAKARQDAEAEQAEVNKALAVAMPQFNEAVAADPSLTDVYNQTLASMAREIAFVNGIPTNVPLTPAQKDFIGRELAKLEQGHIKFAVAQGRNVADYMREFAAARGITAQPAAASVAAPAAAAAPAKTIAERASAQQRHMSIGDLPGSAVPEKISAKDLVKMSSAEFAAFAKKMGDAGLDELFKNA